MRKPDYIDLFLDYLDGKLDKELADDIKKTLPNDPVLNTTVEGLTELYEEHGRDREALRQYFKDTEEEITSNLIKKGYSQKTTKKTINSKIALLSILGIGLVVFGLWFWSNRSASEQSTENNTNTSVVDTLENTVDSNQIEVEENEEEVQKDDKVSKPQNNSKPLKDDKKNSSQPSKPIAFGGKGSNEKLPHIESMIGTKFRDNNNQILQDTTVRYSFFTTTQSLEINKPFTISEQYLSKNPILYIFNFDTEDNKMSYPISEKEYILQEHLPLGLYYWIIEVEGIKPVYGSIIIQKE